MRSAIIGISKRGSVHNIPTKEMLETSLQVFFEKQGWSVSEISIVSAGKTILISLLSDSNEDNVQELLHEFLSLFDHVQWWKESDEKKALIQRFPDITFGERDYPVMFFEGLKVVFSAPSSEDNNTILQQYILRAELEHTEDCVDECHSSVESTLNNLRSLLPG